MIQKLRNRQGGFTLIELLIVVAIIGIIAALLIPNLLDAIQKAKQKRTMADIRTTGLAWTAWLTDNASSAAAGQGQTYNFTGNNKADLTYSAIYNLLIPSTSFFYVQEVPEQDAWGGDYQFKVITGYSTDARVLFQNSDIMAIRSTGRDGSITGSEAAYPVGAFTATDYDQDIVWANGSFVHYPGGTQTAAP